MANTSSAQRAARVAKRKTQVNKSRLSRMKSVVRSVEEAISSGNKQAAAEALAVAQPIMMRAAQKGIVHKKSASRKVSRLTARLKTLAN